MIPHELFVRLSRSRDYLAQNHAERVTVTRAAREAAISPYHYIRLFRKAFGQTPHQFALEQRIAEARRLLSRTDLPVTEICFEIGYDSPASFSTLFRQTTQMSPSEFRRSTGRVFAIRWAARPPYIPSCFLAEYGLELPFSGRLLQKRSFR